MKAGDNNPMAATEMDTDYLYVATGGPIAKIIKVRLWCKCSA
jgi:hypothetical protein